MICNKEDAFLTKLLENGGTVDVHGLGASSSYLLHTVDKLTI